MKFKYWMAAASVALFVVLCGFKASTTQSSPAIGQSEQVQLEQFSKAFYEKAASHASMVGAPKHTTTLVLVVVFAVAVNTPGFGSGGKEVDQVSLAQKTRVKALDAN